MFIELESAIPIFVCDSCGFRDEAWKKFYEEYLSIFKVKENWEQEKHRVSCVLGLFCFLYKEKYGIDYIFVPKNPNPFSIKECRDANVLIATFGKNMESVRKYLVWAFRKGIGNNSKITSLAYLSSPGLVRRYVLYAEKRDILTRSSTLPSKFLDWCKEAVPDIFKQYNLETMNDLGSLLNHVVTYGSPTDSAEFRLIKKSEEFGLIVDNKLNIGK